ncbi:hypothetical protein CRG98_043845 [Punica granatum]|uniref:Amino acid transporter transmembrane domain-containing protein n=1 Tax=Punica granatum TaxID=22663 RepID=A0A2I0HVG3_PUNGR|nr:hypothetical protein CRG98_043845 [Punica granatum]
MDSGGAYINRGGGSRSAVPSMECGAESGTVKGSITGVPSSNSATKTFAVFTALGNIAFAYPFAIILFEIEDTLKSPPPVNKTMKTACTIALSIITFFFLCYGCLGYAAFGDSTPENLLTGFGFYEPYWLVDFANACVVIYLMGAYQIYSQACFSTVERWFCERFPDSRFLDKSFSFKFPLLPAIKMNLFRACFRTLYVATATLLAIMFPYFTSVIGVLGAVFFWPFAVYAPVQMEEPSQILERAAGALLLPISLLTASFPLYVSMQLDSAMFEHPINVL